MRDKGFLARSWTCVAFLGLALPGLGACSGGSGAGGSSATSGDSTYDVVIVNGKIVDGTGNPWFFGDVAIRGDRVVRVVRRGMLGSATAKRRIDATGRIVAPGFIDIQAGGPYLTGDGRSVSKLTQGVTTEIMGEGYTSAPISDLTLADLSAAGPDTAAVASARRFQGDRGFDAWLRAMEAHGVSPNVGAFVGASTLRQYGMGLKMGAAGPAPLDSMRAALKRAMEDGAFGLGSALIYPPGNFASTEELIEVAKAMAPYGGLYITHMRSEADQVLEGIDEALRIGHEAGVAVEIYHLKAAGIRNWKKMPVMIAKIDSARAAGQDVQATMYPYTAGGTGLAACLPPFASEDGKLLKNLADPAARARIRAEVVHPTSYWESLCELATPQGVLLGALRGEANQPWSRQRLSAVVSGTRKDWLDAVMDLLLAEGRNIGAIYFLMNEDNVKLTLKQPWMIIGTDAGGMDPDSARGGAHPRAYGTYTRILGKYVRDEGILPLEEAIRKMTGAVAERLLIADRGLLREGLYADVVVFDPATIQEHSTFEEPHKLSTGVEHVLVNGVAVVSDGRHTGAKPGRAIRGAGWRGTAEKSER